MGRDDTLERRAHRLVHEDTHILVGDCIKRLQNDVKDGEVDLVFADPPFNIGVDYGGWNDKQDPEAFTQFTYNWIGQCVRALRPGGALFLHVPDDLVYDCLTATNVQPLTRINWLIWHYGFGQHTKGRFISSHIHLLYFVKDPAKERTWNIEEVLEPSERLRSGDRRVSTAEHAGYRPFLDVWYGPNLGRIQGNNKERRKLHPNQLPELYLARIIRATTDEGDLVCDPFVGSGTTPTVAHALGRRFIGCELNPKFARSAMRRVKRGPVRDVGGPLAKERSDE